MRRTGWWVFHFSTKHWLWIWIFLVSIFQVKKLFLAFLLHPLWEAPFTCKLWKIDLKPSDRLLLCSISLINKQPMKTRIRDMIYKHYHFHESLVVWVTRRHVFGHLSVCLSNLIPSSTKATDQGCNIRTLRPFFISSSYHLFNHLYHFLSFIPISIALLLVYFYYLLFVTINL